MSLKVVFLVALAAVARAQVLTPLGFAAPLPYAATLRAELPQYSFDSAVSRVLTKLKQETADGSTILRATFDVVERDGSVRTVSYLQEANVIFNLVANRPAAASRQATTTPQKSVDPSGPAILEKLKHETRNGGIILRATFDLIDPAGRVRAVSYYEDSSLIFSIAVANRPSTVAFARLFAA